MRYCKPGDKPTVEYSFAESPSKLYKSTLAPIDVIVRDRPIESSENYRGNGYSIRVWSVDAGRFLDLTLRDHEIFQSPHTGEYVFTAMRCDQTSFPLAYSNPQECALNKVEYRKCRQAFTIDPSKGITINESVNCPVSIKKECNILIAYDGKTIFTDRGDCPVKVKVACGNCPPDHVECKTDSYPGYCCIPCDEIKAGITEAIASLKRLNNG